MPVQLGKIQIKSIPSFNPNTDDLPLMLTMDANITSVRLGIQLMYGDYASFEAFPDYTMFSLDGGASYYMLFGDHLPEFGLDGVTSVPVLLDFSYADLSESVRSVDDGKETSEKLTLAMEAYTGERMRKCVTVDVLPDMQETAMDSVYPQIKAVDGSLRITEESASEMEQFPQLVLTTDHTLEVLFPVEWKDAKLDYAVDMLTMTEEQTLEYAPVELTKDGMYATYHLDENTHKIVLRIGQKLVQSGTYRLNITWSYEDVDYVNKQITFFVNCPIESKNETDGQEVRNDN